MALVGALPRTIRFRMPSYPHRKTAAQILVLCCVLWAFSFPFTKTLQSLGNQAIPGVSSVFLSSWAVVIRFGMGALVLFIMTARRLPGITSLEVQQGLGLGFFGGLGMFFQLDGLTYTHASTSAFFTQAYCVLIPLWVAVSRRKWPPVPVWIACTLAVAGATILADLSPQNVRLGRGEWETLAGSVFFSGQILMLDHPRYEANDVGRFSLVMFLSMVGVCLPVAWVFAAQPSDFLHVYSAPASAILLLLLTIGCTVLTYLLMNRWQRELPATEAGLLYCGEPVFTSALCLFLPGWLSSMSGIAYPDETLTSRLLLGGLLILTANVLIQLRGVGSDN